MKRLRNSVRLDGWKDVSPRDINLIIMPEGEYTGKFIVSNGGNHRAVVSNEFRIKRIKADIGAFLNKNSLTADELDEIENKEFERSKLYKSLKAEKNDAERDVISKSIRDIDDYLDTYIRNLYYRSVR